MNDELLKYIIARVLENAVDSIEEYKKDKNNLFAGGMAQAFYETLDIIKNELDVAGFDLAEFGLNKNMENIF